MKRILFAVLVMLIGQALNVQSKLGIQVNGIVSKTENSMDVSDGFTMNSDYKERIS